MEKGSEFIGYLAAVAILHSTRHLCHAIIKCKQVKSPNSNDNNYNNNNDILITEL